MSLPLNGGRTSLTFHEPSGLWRDARHTATLSVMPFAGVPPPPPGTSPPGAGGAKPHPPPAPAAAGRPPGKAPGRGGGGGPTPAPAAGAGEAGAHSRLPLPQRGFVRVRGDGRFGGDAARRGRHTRQRRQALVVTAHAAGLLVERRPDG